MLERTIASYEQCLRGEPKGSTLAADARNNSELAKALLARAKVRESARKNQEQANDARSHEPGDRNGAKAESDPSQGDTRPARRNRMATNTPQEPLATEQRPPPGKGNLPPIADRDKNLPSSAEDTTAYLEKAAERIARERREHQRRAAHASSAGTLDW